jgi:hypothetical protein
MCSFDATATIVRLGRIPLTRSPSIAESAGNDRSLTAPVIQAVSDLLLAHPAWFGSDWLDALDKIDLSALHESAKANRKAVQPRAAVAAVLLERLKDRLPVTRCTLYRVNGAEIIRARATIGVRTPRTASALCVFHYDQPEGAPPPPERYRGRRSSSGGGGSWQSAWLFVMARALIWSRRESEKAAGACRWYVRELPGAAACRIRLPPSGHRGRPITFE